MMLTITLGDRADLTWAQIVAIRYHYLHQPVDPRARPMVYTLDWKQMRVGVSNPRRKRRGFVPGAALDTLNASETFGTLTGALHQYTGAAS